MTGVLHPLHPARKALDVSRLFGRSAKHSHTDPCTRMAPERGVGVAVGCSVGVGRGVGVAVTLGLGVGVGVGKETVGRSATVGAAPGRVGVGPSVGEGSKAFSCRRVGVGAGVGVGSGRVMRVGVAVGSGVGVGGFSSNVAAYRTSCWNSATHCRTPLGSSGIAAMPATAPRTNRTRSAKHRISRTSRCRRSDPRPSSLP